MASDTTRYTNKVFMTGALPLLKTIADDVPELKKKFEGVNAVYQVSAMANAQDKEAIHFIIEDGEWTVKLGEYLGQQKIDAELQFSSMEKMNAFFKGNMSALPKMKTKLYFYLLSSGISQLNKMGHPAIREWTSKSPDRVYQWAVEGHPECTAYLRIKAGKSRAGRGEYKRSKPFFCMKFDTAQHALMILLGTGDMLQMTKDKQLIMEGAPEFGAMIGEYMMIVGDLAS